MDAAQAEPRSTGARGNLVESASIVGNGQEDFAVTFAPTVAPEPTTVTLLATGLLFLCAIQHRSRRRRPIHKTSAA